MDSDHLTALFSGEVFYEYNMNNQKKIIKFTKPASNPLVIGAGGGVKTVKKENTSSSTAQGAANYRCQRSVKSADVPQPQQQNV